VANVVVWGSCAMLAAPHIAHSFSCMENVPRRRGCGSGWRFTTPRRSWARV
jgi:hypothetical protein